MSNKSAPKSTAETSTEVLFIKKLNVKEIAGRDLEIGEKVAVAGTVLGYSTEKSKNADMGDYSKFKGSFSGKFGNRVVSASVLYLPAIGDEMLKMAFDAQDGKAVEFHFEITKAKDDDKKNARGFKWALIPKGDAVTASARHIALLNG